MRLGRLSLLVLVSLALIAAPAGALSPPAPGPGGVTASPVAGGPGTEITVTGHCHGDSQGDAYLERTITSDAIHPPLVHKSFMVSNEQFSVTMTNPLGDEQGFPVDLVVRISCAGVSATTPFHASSMPVATSPRIFTSLGPKGCGTAFGDPRNDLALPCRPHVKGFVESGALAQTNFFAAGEESGGLSVGAGDVDDNGSTDIVVGSAPGAPGRLKVFGLNGTLLAQHAVYGEFGGGVNVAVGDVNGDGKDDIVTGAGAGGGPHILAFTYNTATKTFDLISSFYAYQPGFTGGVKVAAGHMRIVTGPGAGGGPHVRAFGANGQEVAGFYAYEPGFTGGVEVAVPADASRIVTAAGPGGGPHVALFSSSGVPAGGFYAYEPGFTGGVSVAVGGAPQQIVTGPGPGGGPHVAIFNADGSPKGGFYAHQNFTAGLKVAAAP